MTSSENFSLDIIPCDQVISNEDDEKIMVMHHGAQYNIALENKLKDRRCDADVFIDGKKVNRIRINPQDVVLLEHPRHTDKCFTFFRGGSREAQQCGYEKDKPTNGVVQVHFTPEHKPQRDDSLTLEANLGDWYAEFNIRVDITSDHVCDVKWLIEQKFRVPTEKQVLQYKGNNLEDSKSLLDVGVRGDTKMHLVLPRDIEMRGGLSKLLEKRVRATKGRIQLFVKTLTGMTHSLLVHPAFDTVLDIKYDIWKETGIPPIQQRLIWGGRILEDGQAIIDTGIKKESTVHLITRLRGGGSGPPPGMVEGITGFTGHSCQEFTYAECITLDEAAMEELKVRLMAKEDVGDDWPVYKKRKSN